MQCCSPMSLLYSLFDALGQSGWEKLDLHPQVGNRKLP
jgi:hypothetical protein